MNEKTKKQMIAFAAVFVMFAVAFGGLTASESSTADTANEPLGYLIGPAVSITSADTLPASAGMGEVYVVGANVYEWVSKGVYVEPITDSTNPIAIAALSVWFSYCPQATYDSNIPTYTTLIGIPSYTTAYPNVLMYIAYTDEGGGVIDGTLDIQVGLASGYEVFAGAADVTIPAGVTHVDPTDASTYPTATGLSITNYTGGVPLIDPPITCNITSWNVQNFANSGFVLVQTLPATDNGGSGTDNNNGNANGSANNSGTHNWNWALLVICILIILALAVVAYFLKGLTGSAAVTIVGLIVLVILILYRVI